MARFRRRNSGASFGRWRFAGGGMRSILNAGLAAVVGTLLCFGLSSALAQKSNQANKLEDKFLKLYDAGRYADAIPIAQRVLTIRDKALGHNHPAVAIALDNLANLYRLQGRYADAEPLLQRSLAIREQALGHDDPDTAGSLLNLAALYLDQSRYADAEPLLQQSLAIWEKAFGRDQ